LATGGSSAIFIRASASSNGGPRASASFGPGLTADGANDPCGLTAALVHEPSVVIMSVQNFSRTTAPPRDWLEKA